MATGIDAGKLIGVTLYANKTINLLDSDFKTVIGKVNRGGFVGKIYSWIERPGALYWMFYNSKGRAYYVKHEETAFSRTKEITNLEKKQEIKDEAEIIQAEKEAKGNFQYYFERYGKQVLWVAVGLFVFKTLVQNQKR